MLLIPIGAEEDGSRATPLATLVLIALNVLWFVALNFFLGASDWKSELESARSDLETFWSEHRDLTPPASLARLLGPEEFAEMAEEVRASAASRKASMAWLDEVNRQGLDRRDLRFEEALAQRPSYRYGFVASKPSVPSVLGSLVTHAGFVHLAGNMLFLWALGPFVESALGAGLFLLLYFLSGGASVLVFWLASGPTPIPLVGASGAIAGVMGALLIRNAFASIRFLFVPILWAPRFRVVFGVPAFVILPLWFAEQVISARLEPDAPVAWWAHIGGFVFGMAAAALVPRKAPKRIQPARAVPRRAPPASVNPSSSFPSRAHPSTSALIPPRASVIAKCRLRVAVVSSGMAGALVLTRGTEQLLAKNFARNEAGALALDEMLDLASGPTDLRVELRIQEGAPRYASVAAILKPGETQVLRIEPRQAGILAQLR